MQDTKWPSFTDFHTDDTGKTEDAKFIALCQVNSSICSLEMLVDFMYNKSP